MAQDTQYFYPPSQIWPLYWPRIGFKAFESLDYTGVMFAHTIRIYGCFRLIPTWSQSLLLGSVWMYCQALVSLLRSLILDFEPKKSKAPSQILAFKIFVKTKIES